MFYRGAPDQIPQRSGVSTAMRNFVDGLQQRFAWNNDQHRIDNNYLYIKVKWNRLD